MQRSEPLARLDRDMRLPPRPRLDLLQELEADLEALFRELVSRGMKPERARQVAQSRLLPDADTLDHLEVEHQSVGARWLRQFRWLAYAERCALVLTVGIPTSLTLWALRHSGVTTSNFLVGVELLIVAALGANWTRTAWALWVRRDLRPRRRRTNWRLHVGLIVAAVAIGALGAAWEGYALLNFEGGSVQMVVPMWTIVRSALALATLGTAAAIFGLFGWLALIPRLATDDIVETRIAEMFRRTSAGFDPTRR